MSKYRVAYVDDNIDPDLSEYFDKRYGETYFELKFDLEKKYEDLLGFVKEKQINILIIDSFLFENSTAGSKFTGDEFSIILKKIYPYIETVLISANSVRNDITIKKYKSRIDYSFEDYTHELNSKLANVEHQIDFIHDTLESMKNNKDIDSALVEQIENTAQKITDYQELKKEDIDKIIDMFKDIEEKIDGRL